jgi:hypothetical protein
MLNWRCLFYADATHQPQTKRKMHLDSRGLHFAKMPDSDLDG